MSSLKEKRAIMAKKFETTQRAMSSTVDELSLMRRRAVPYSSTWQGSSISMHGPIPTDAHLIPSNYIIKEPERKNFEVMDGEGAVSSGGKPWASYLKPAPSVFASAAAMSSEAMPAAPPSR